MRDSRGTAIPRTCDLDDGPQGEFGVTLLTTILSGWVNTPSNTVPEKMEILVFDKVFKSTKLKPRPRLYKGLVDLSLHIRVIVNKNSFKDTIYVTPVRFYLCSIKDKSSSHIKFSLSVLLSIFCNKRHYHNTFHAVSVSESLVSSFLASKFGLSTGRGTVSTTNPTGETGQYRRRSDRCDNSLTKNFLQFTSVQSGVDF